ncbi:MAG: hypothetical protein NZ874_02170 [Fimbriimonadales bacterium]|nr:hypothetical protein [Fimbriimonadales bacterium]
MRIVSVVLSVSIVCSSLAQRTYQAQPTDDVWVYSFAFNAGTTTVLRAWGDGVTSVSSQAPPGEPHSYSYAKWTLTGVRAGVNYQVLNAQLTVVQTQPPGYTRESGQQNPLEVRDLSSTNWNEATWRFSDAATITPGNILFGEGTMENYRLDAPFEIPIPIDVALFEPYFNAAISQNNGVLGLAFTSRLSPEGMGAQNIYRFYSRNDTGGRGPVLRVVYRVAGDATGDGCTNDADLLTVLLNFGGNNAQADLNRNGTVEDTDLLIVLLNFGNGCGR